MPAQFLVFLPLVRIDENGEMEGALARDWEYSPDTRTWTIHLRTDVLWHDGVRFTAGDIVFTHQLATHPDVLWENPGLRTVTATNDSTVVFQTDTWLGNPLEAWRPFYPKHLLEHLDPGEVMEWEFWTEPVGNGPYRYVRHVSRTMTELEANPDYFRGQPEVERVILKFGGEGGPTVPELLSGNVDVLGWAGRLDAVHFADDPEYRVIHSVSVEATRGIMWNVGSPLFSDARVRRALTLAVDRRELHGAVGIPPEVPLPDGLVTERQFRRGEVPPELPFDRPAAERLLEEAGWRDLDGDGVRERDGRPFRFSLLVPSDEEGGAVYLQHQLSQVGVQAEVVTLDINVIRRRSQAGDFEAILVWLNGNRLGPFFGSGGTAGYSNPRVDALLARVREVVDLNERDALMAEIYEIFREEQPATILFPNVSQHVIPRWLVGLSSPHRTDPVLNMEFLRIEGRN
jgi:peptide/nickel transport system substrate-binding protein